MAEIDQVWDRLKKVPSPDDPIKRTQKEDAAHLLDCKRPDYQPFERIATDLSPMALSFWRDNRRVSNQRLTQELGYQLRYPSYREGLKACLNEEAAAPD